MAKLPVWPTVKAAYAAVWTHRWRLLRFAVVPFALMAAIDAGGAHLGEAMAVSSADDTAAADPAAIAIEQFAWLLNSIVLIAFIVPCYRVLLSGRARFDPGDRRAARRAYLGMLAVTVLLALVFEVPLALLDLPSHSLGTEGVLAAQVGLTLGFFWVTIKLAFLSPTICLARPWNLRQRWRETGGNFWRLVAALATVLLPVIAAVVLWAVSLGFWDEISGTAVSWSPVWEAMTVAAAWLISEALAAAVVVIAFAVLTGYPAKGLARFKMGGHPAPTGG